MAAGPASLWDRGPQGAGLRLLAERELRLLPPGWTTDASRSDPSVVGSDSRSVDWDVVVTALSGEAGHQRRGFSPGERATDCVFNRSSSALTSPVV